MNVFIFSRAGMSIGLHTIWRKRYPVMKEQDFQLIYDIGIQWWSIVQIKSGAPWKSFILRREELGCARVSEAIRWEVSSHTFCYTCDFCGRNQGNSW